MPTSDSSHGGGQNRPELPELADEHFKQPRELARDFGLCVKKIRETKARPPNSHGRGTCTTQADLAFDLHESWQRRTGENRTFDAAWVRKLEAGKVLVDMCLARCTAEALRADRDETTLLLQMAGYNGVAIVVLEDMGANLRDFEAQVAACVGQMAKGEMPLREVLHIMGLRRHVVSKEISRALRERGDLP